MNELTVLQFTVLVFIVLYWFSFIVFEVFISKGVILLQMWEKHVQNSAISL